MECNVQKPTKLKIYFGGQLLRGAAAVSSTCTLCGRTFSSVKALHGHMRWHKAVPLPPPTTQKLGDQLDFDPPPRPLPLPLGWCRTAKRTLIVPVDTDPEVIDVREVEGEGEGEGKDPAEEEEPPASEMSTVDGAVASEEDPGALEHCGQAREPSESPPCCCDCCRRWESRPRDQPAPPAPFACAPCGRAFPSYPALCGHMASHGKQHNHLRDGDPRLDGSWKAPKRRRVKGAAADTAEHRCNVCGRVFPTGQALGGHKRLHWEGPKICPTLLLLPPPAANPAEVEKKDTPAKIHDFDLNETPVGEDGAERNMQELLLLV